MMTWLWVTRLQCVNQREYSNREKVGRTAGRKKGKGQTKHRCGKWECAQWQNWEQILCSYWICILVTSHFFSDGALNRRVNEPRQFDKASVSQCCLWPWEAVKHIWNGAGYRFCTGGPHNSWQSTHDCSFKHQLHVVCVDNCKCTTGAMHLHPSYSFSNPHWNTQGLFPWH